MYEHLCDYIRLGHVHVLSESLRNKLSAIAKIVFHISSEPFYSKDDSISIDRQL